MKPKSLSLAFAALLIVGALWLARSAWRTPVTHPPGQAVGAQTPDGPKADPRGAVSEPRASQAGPAAGPNDPRPPGPMLLPPNPNRRFEKLTPEQRVKLARQGPVGG